MSDSTSDLDLIELGQANIPTRLMEALDALSPASLGGRRASTTTGLTWGFYGGKVLINGVPTAVANGTVMLTASTTNYVSISQAGAVVTATTENPANAPLYTVVTGTATVTSYVDKRTPKALARLSYGVGTQAMADANKTLTQALALCDTLVTTGVLTATRNLIVPLVRRQWTVRNTCTGGSIQVIGATGTGVTIATVKTAIVECDGTNVVRITADT